VDRLEGFTNTALMGPMLGISVRDMGGPSKTWACGALSFFRFLLPGAAGLNGAAGGDALRLEDRAEVTATPRPDLFARRR
jgi:hypothetical protein